MSKRIFPTGDINLHVTLADAGRTKMKMLAYEACCRYRRVALSAAPTGACPAWFDSNIINSIILVPRGCARANVLMNCQYQYWAMCCCLLSRINQRHLHLRLYTT